MVEPALLVGAIVLAAVVLLVTEWLSADLVALLVLVSLALTGVLTPQEAVAGFASTATLTVLAMFVLSQGVFRTGLVTFLSNRLHRIGAGPEAKVIIVIALVVAPLSAFMNNTAAVAIFMPLVIALAVGAKRAPSRFLIPLSYASQMGGVLTLIGTSTNILASELAERSGYRALSMFEFTRVGLIILLVGTAYLVFIAPRLLPHRGQRDQVFEPRFRVRLVIGEGSSLEDVVAASKDAAVRLGGDVLSVRRAGHALAPAEARLHAGDIVEIEGTPHGLLHAEEGGTYLPYGQTRFKDGLEVEEGYTVVEAVVSPGSALIGAEASLSRLAEIDTHVIGIRRKERFVPAWIAPEIEAGDTLLLIAGKARLEEIRDHRDIILVQEVPLVEFRWHRIPHVAAIFAGVIGLAALDVFPIVVTALAGAAAMVITGVLTMREFYKSIRWDVILLLAGLIPLGTALVKTGGAATAASWFGRLAGDLPAWGVLFAVYILTAVITEVLSNNGTVVLMVPVTVTLAAGMGLDPLPFILAVAYAASTSFMTPVGYQTNTMVYGPGDYRFSDFFRVGAPLNLLLAIVTTAALAWTFDLM